MSGKSWIGFVAGAAVAIAAALVVGVSDHLPGIALVYVACVLLILAVAHRWRQVRPFRWLLLGSLALFPVAALLHNLLYALGEIATGTPLVRGSLEALHVAFFLSAILLSPAGVIVGAVGALLAWRRSRLAA